MLIVSRIYQLPLVPERMQVNSMVIEYRKDRMRLHGLSRTPTKRCAGVKASGEDLRLKAVTWPSAGAGFFGDPLDDGVIHFLKPTRQPMILLTRPH